MRRIAVLDAPSTLGLRPPTATLVPGCPRPPGARRDQGRRPRLAARGGGCRPPPRYDPGDWRPGAGVCHAEAIGWYSRRLADRIGTIVEAGEFPLVLGGDCSILLGSALALARMRTRDELPYGVVYVDGHSDFRHPGNASYVGAAAGEDLALATGRGQPDLTDLEGLRPYVRAERVVLLGIRAQDEYRLDLQAAGVAFRAVPQLRVDGAGRTAQWAREHLADTVGYWLHVDVDVLDPAVMPAVDAPDDGGVAFAELEQPVAGFVGTPDCLGMQLTVFDPDYDPAGADARELVGALVTAPPPPLPPPDAPRPPLGEQVRRPAQHGRRHRARVGEAGQPAVLRDVALQLAGRRLAVVISHGLVVGEDGLGDRDQLLVGTGDVRDDLFCGVPAIYRHPEAPARRLVDEVRVRVHTEHGSPAEGATR